MELHTQHAFCASSFLQGFAFSSTRQFKVILGSPSHFAYSKCTPEFLRAVLTAWKHKSSSLPWGMGGQAAAPVPALPAIPCSSLWNTIPTAQPAQPGLPYIEQTLNEELL